MLIIQNISKQEYRSSGVHVQPKGYYVAKTDAELDIARYLVTEQSCLFKDITAEIPEDSDFPSGPHSHRGFEEFLFDIEAKGIKIAHLHPVKEPKKSKRGKKSKKTEKVSKDSTESGESEKPKKAEKSKDDKPKKATKSKDDKPKKAKKAKDVPAE